MSKLFVFAAAAGLVLNACGRRNDSVHRDLKSKDAETEIQSAAVSSTDSSGQQPETTSESAAREAGSSTSSPVGNTASNSTATPSASLPSGLKPCGAPGNSCYQDDKAMAAGKAQLSDGSTISLVAASNGFKVWKDDASSKILKASGLYRGKDDWQKKLQPSGFGAAPDYFTEFAGIAGRACPEMSYRAASVAPSPEDNCLYYDGGTPNVALGLELSHNKNIGVEGTDWVGWWGRALQDYCPNRCQIPSYFVGNIRTCNVKGMRLPTIYEAEADIKDPVFAATYFPKMTVDIDKWLTQSGAKYASVGHGVPAVPGKGWTYTASGVWQNIFPYNYFIYDGKRHIEKSSYNKTQNVRCVLP